MDTDRLIQENLTNIFRFGSEEECQESVTAMFERFERREHLEEHAIPI